MGTVPKNVSSCRHCQFYGLEGMRGGHCHQLGVPVQGRWQACSLAIPPFLAEVSATPGIMALQQSLELENVPSPVLALSEECIEHLASLTSVSSHNLLHQKC